MSEFVWEARTRTGELRKGKMESGDAEAVRARLRQQQLNPTKVKRAIGINISFGGGVPIKELVTFTRLFGTMIDAGLPLVQALDVLAGQQTNKQFKAVLVDIKGSVEQGSTFSDALKRHPKIFDDLFVNLVAAGEAGGLLDTIMSRLSVYLEKRQKLHRQIKSAMTYPSIVIVIAIVVMVILMTFVIPSFETMFKEIGGGSANLPGITLFVIAISENFLSASPYIAVGAIILVAAVVQTYRRPNGKRVYHRIFLRLPVMGDVVRKVAVARFTRTLGTLLSSGVPILDALSICAKSSGNVVVEEAINRVALRISEGKNMAEPLAQSGIFPHMVVQMIGVGEQTGALDQMLSKIADFYEEETDVAVAALTTMLEPILMVGVGGMVGFVLVSMYLPIFSLAGNIKAQ
jgi:type IV pilus assembly protein PilC